MGNNEAMPSNDIKIDSKKVKSILLKLLIKEVNNIKSKQYNDSEMVKIIKKIIEEEVQCYSGE